MAFPVVRGSTRIPTTLIVLQRMSRGAEPESSASTDRQALSAWIGVVTSPVGQRALGINIIDEPLVRAQLCWSFHDHLPLCSLFICEEPRASFRGPGLLPVLQLPSAGLLAARLEIVAYFHKYRTDGTGNSADNHKGCSCVHSFHLPGYRV